jgi:hypothetical protein
MPREFEAESPGYRGASVYSREIAQCQDQHGTCQTVPTRRNGTVGHYSIQGGAEGMESD